MGIKWVRFEKSGGIGFGCLEGEQIRVHSGDMFDQPKATGETVALSSVRLICPVVPTKVVALWNNFAQLSAKLNLSKPPEPLYLLKAPNSFSDPEALIPKPAAEGKVVFEGELGIVIGKRAKAVSVAEANDFIFGFTIANDVTHSDILFRDSTFPQWVRSKGFDGFLPMGPCVVTGLDAKTLVVKTVLNGDVRQEYPIADMHYTVQELVSLISADMTLMPGDVIICGTSVGVGSMKPGSDVSVEINGIGVLRNRFA